MWAFVSLLLAGGRHEGQALLSPGAVGAMTRDHLTADQRASAQLSLGEHGGWGYCMAAPGPSWVSPRGRGGSAGTAARAPCGAPTPSAA